MASWTKTGRIADSLGWYRDGDWIDLASLLPYHEPVDLVDNDHLGVGPAPVNGMYGIAKYIGTDDGVSITVWHERATAGLDGIVDDIGWQPAPIAFFRPPKLGARRIITANLSNPSAGLYAVGPTDGSVFTTDDLGAIVRGVGLSDFNSNTGVYEDTRVIVISGGAAFVSKALTPANGVQVEVIRPHGSKIVTDAQTVAGSRVITSPSAPFTKDDEGKWIVGASLGNNTKVDLVVDESTIWVSPHPTTTETAAICLSEASQIAIGNYFDITQSVDGAYYGAWSIMDAHDYLASSYYVIYDVNWDPQVNAYPVPNPIELRIFGGRMAGYVNGSRVWGPIPVPAWAKGRDGVGGHCIMAAAPIANKGNIKKVEVKPWNTDLGSYPAAPSTRSLSAAVEAAAAASITIPYPPTIQAGDRLVFYVMSFNQTIVNPDAAVWNMWSDAVSSQSRLTILEKKGGATGTETGNLVIAASGASDMGGFSQAIQGVNRRGPAFSATLRHVNTAQSVLDAGVHLIQGYNRRVFWIAGRHANNTINPPPGFTTEIELGITGVVLNYKLASKVISKSPAGETGDTELQGSWGGGVTANYEAARIVTIPDPR